MTVKKIVPLNGIQIHILLTTLRLEVWDINVDNKSQVFVLIGGCVSD